MIRPPLGYYESEPGIPVVEFKEGDLIGPVPSPVGEIVKSHATGMGWHLEWLVLPGHSQRNSPEGTIYSWDGPRTANDTRWRLKTYVIQEELLP